LMIVSQPSSTPPTGWSSTQPTQVSVSGSQVPPAGHSVPGTQAPEPLQASPTVQPLSSSQVVPWGWKPASAQTPPTQVSWLVQAVPVSPQRVPSTALRGRQLPAPSQVSGSVQVVSAVSPQALPTGD